MLVAAIKFPFRSYCARYESKLSVLVSVLVGVKYKTGLLKFPATYKLLPTITKDTVSSCNVPPILFNHNSVPFWSNLQMNPSCSPKLLIVSVPICNVALL